MKKATRLLFQLVAIAMLSIVGTIQASADELTVYDGTNLNSFVPYYSEYGDFTQKHEFIIPASQLTAMNGATVKKLTFYSSTEHSTPDFTFKIFLKEVDQTTFTGFIGDEGATTVYEGTLTLANNKVEFAFTNDYQYNGGNLMIGFYTLSVGMYTSLGFYGVAQEENTAIYGMGEMSGNYENVSAPTVTSNDKFLPKTTFTYEAGAATEATVIADILAYKNFEMTDPTAESEEVELVLTNAKVTYINQEQDAVAIEDESAGYLFELMGLSSLLEEGQTLNGKLAMTASEGYFAVNFQLKDGINGLTATAGEVAPMVVTEANASDYANDYDWRLAQFKDITVKVEQGSYGAEPSVLNPIISDDPLPIYDRFEVMDQNIADGTVGTITGFLASLYGMTIFMPTAFEEKAEIPVTEIANILAYKNFEMTDPTAESEEVELVLTNAKVTYINQEQDAVAIEDESAGYLFELMGLSSLLEEGQTLNGKLAMTASEGYFAVNFQLKDGINGLTATAGEVAPMVVTEDNASDYANDYDWRLAQFKDITVKVEQGSYGAEPSIINPIISDDPLPIYDRFEVMDQNIADGTVGTITGFLASLYGMTIFMPTAFEEKAETPVTEIADIAAFKTFEMSDPEAQSEKVVLILNNVKVTQVGETYDDVVMEDESAGWMFQDLGLKELVSEGQILNGRLEMTASPGWYNVAFTLTNGLEGVTVTEEEIAPIEVTGDNIDTYANDYDWRYAKVADVTLKGYTDEWGKYYTLTSELLGGDEIMISETFYTMDSELEDGTIGTITGFLASAYGMNIFYVTNFEAEENAISNVNTTAENGKTAIYNLRGQLLSAPTRGINIINGKKVVIK